MSRQIAAALGVLIGAACTSLTPVADCSSGACPSGQACDPGSHLCVLDESPQITVFSPAPDAAVKTPALEVRGTVITWSDSTLVGMSYALADAGSAGTVPVDGGLFALTVPLPPINGQDVQLVLLARDTRNRERRVSVPFFLDDVAPRPIFLPGDGERGADVQLTVDFGESVTGASVPAVLLPSGATGVFDATHRRYVFSGLAYDTCYQVGVDASLVLDGLGTPNLPGIGSLLDGGPSGAESDHRRARGCRVVRRRVRRGRCGHPCRRDRRARWCGAGSTHRTGQFEQLTLLDVACSTPGRPAHQHRIPGGRRGSAAGRSGPPARHHRPAGRAHGHGVLHARPRHSSSPPALRAPSPPHRWARWAC